MDSSKHQNRIDDNSNATNSSSTDNSGIKKSRKLHRSKKNIKQKEEKIMTPKKWRCLDSLGDDRDERLLSILLVWGRERGFYFLGLFCLMMCAVLFGLQAYLAFRSYKMLHQITTKRNIPETLYQIYFDGHDWALDLDKVDLRANTSLFMH